MAKRRRVYLNEFNITMGNYAYLPLVSGLLQAHAQSFDDLRAAYDFRPYLFHTDSPEAILAAYDAPDVAAFSVSMWNEQLNLRIARAVKERWPDCLIVFGGANVPHDPTDYFREYPFIDLAVRAEGEEPFAEILRRRMSGRGYADIAAVSYRDPASGACIHATTDTPFSRDLDVYASPYLEGLYDRLIADHPEFNFQAILETNRGCPFLCTFCFWGKGGLSRKYRYRGIDRVKAELRWCAEHGIKYVFNADSNFGMHARDMEIAHYIVDLKTNLGFPEKFRTCYGKNTDERIFEIGALFHRHGIEKGITLSRQSNNATTLKHIKRSNIKLDVYTNLQHQFNDQDIPVYCEMIVGLPGETYETWIAGTEDLLRTGLKNQIFMYHCQIYANTEMADPEYKRAHGLITRTIELHPIHSSRRDPRWVMEFEETVIGTATMPTADWRRTSIFSWITMLLHSLKVGFFLMGYLSKRFGLEHVDFVRFIAEEQMKSGLGGMLRREIARGNAVLDGILAGQGRCSYAPEYGELYWDFEEFSFLEVSKDLDRFYAEMSDVVSDYLTQRGIDFDPDEVADAIAYQDLRIPRRYGPVHRRYEFRTNMPDYFQARWSANPIEVRPAHQVMDVTQPDFAGDGVEYARQVILWGRKSGLLLTDAEWHEESGHEVQAAVAGE
jgi:radical SAM superfamily enzyme YgiQ (UPF0313 family)